MGMKPEDFFEAFVCENYEDYKQHPGCLRRAFNAAVSASHLADHYFRYYKRNDASKLAGCHKWKDFRKNLSTRPGHCFRHVRDIANAYKHLYTSEGPDKGVHSSVSSTGAIESIRWGHENAELREIKQDLSEDLKDGDSNEKVVFTTKHGMQLDFLPELEAVIEYWRKKVS